MKKHKYITIAIILILLLALAVVLLLWWKSRMPSEKERIAAYKEKLALVAKGGNVPITFYGLIVDEEGNPVPEAEIKFHRMYYPAVNVLQGKKADHAEVASDQNGRFEYSGKNGVSIYIDEINKSGYQWIVEIRPTFKYYLDSSQNTYIPDPDNPVRFVMRKKNAATLVFKKDLYDRAYYGKSTYYDVVYHQQWLAEDERFFNSKRRYRTFLRKDLLFKAEKSADGKNCILTFSTPDEGNGIQQLDKVLYTAPETGYLKEVVVKFPVPDDPEENKYALNLYLKLRTGIVDGKEKSIYCRINGQDNSISDEWFTFRLTVCTNPSGGRSLDYSREEYKKFVDREVSDRRKFMNNVGFDEKPNYQR